MATRYIYTQPVSESSLSEAGAQTQRQTTGLGSLTGQASADSVSVLPGERSLTGVYRLDDAVILATELEELFDAPDIEVVPVFVDGADEEWEGYYVLNGLEVSPAHPQANRLFQRYRGKVARTGTRKSHWRAVETSKQSKANDFGSGSTTEIGIPAQASLVRWWDGDAAVTYPSPTATRTGEHRDVEIYDVDAAPYAEPTLLFDLPYGEEGWADCFLWDDRGFADREDANGDVQWARAFSPTHEPSGSWVFSSRLLRVRIDEANQSISAEEWDTSLATPAWEPVTLGTSDWVPVDVDVRTIAPDRLVARVLFKDTTGGSKYPLDMVLCRGDTDALWVRTPNATSSTPSGLVTLLDPIAQTTIYDAGEQQGLKKREEVEQ